MGCSEHTPGLGSPPLIRQGSLQKGDLSGVGEIICSKREHGTSQLTFNEAKLRYLPVNLLPVFSIFQRIDLKTSIENLFILESGAVLWYASRKQEL